MPFVTHLRQGSETRPVKDLNAPRATNVAPNYEDLTFPVSAGQLCWHSGALHAAKVRIASSEAWTASHWEETTAGDESAKLADEIDIVKANADGVNKGLLSLVDYGNETPFEQEEDPSAAGYQYRVGVVRKGNVLTLNKGTKPSTTIRMRISGTIAFAGNASGVAAWEDGLTLIDEHKYKITVQLIGGTSDYDSNTLNVVPYCYVYEVGASTNVATKVRQRDGVSITKFTAHAGKEYILALIIDGGKFTFDDAKMLVVLEDLYETRFTELIDSAAIQNINEAVRKTVNLTSDTQTGGYIELNKTIGTTIPAQVEPDSDYGFQEVECRTGDAFWLTCTVSGDAHRAWAFLDSDRVLLRVAAADVTANSLKLTAYDNGYFICNYALASDFSLSASILQPVVEQVEELTETVLAQKIVTTVSDLDNWTQGYINPSTGTASSSSSRCRREIGWITDPDTVINFPGYNIRFYVYTSSTMSQSYYEQELSSPDWIRGENVGYKASLAEFVGYYVRAVISAGGSSFTPADVSGITLTRERYTDDSLTMDRKAAEAKETGVRIKEVENRVDALHHLVDYGNCEKSTLNGISSNTIKIVRQGTRCIFTEGLVATNGDILIRVNGSLAGNAGFDSYKNVGGGIELENGHTYRWMARLISGSISIAEWYAKVFKEGVSAAITGLNTESVMPDGTRYTDFAYSDTDYPDGVKLTLDFDRSGRAVTFDSAVVECLLEDITGKVNDTLPSGGSAGQVLKKQSAADYDATWGDAFTPATSGQIKGGVYADAPIVPANEHEAAFYGLAKAAGDSTQRASNNEVGTYTDSAKAAILAMLGAADESLYAALRPATDLSGEGTADKYYDLNAEVGASVILQRQSKAGYTCARIACLAGDEFTLTASIPSVSPGVVDDVVAWAFVERYGVGYKLLSRGDPGFSCTDKKLTAPADGFLVVNHYTSANYSLIRKRLFQIPAAPTTDGTYVLTVTVSDGVPNYSWVAQT